MDPPRSTNTLLFYAVVIVSQLTLNQIERRKIPGHYDKGWRDLGSETGLKKTIIMKNNNKKTSHILRSWSTDRGRR